MLFPTTYEDTPSLSDIHYSGMIVSCRLSDYILNTQIVYKIRVHTLTLMMLASEHLAASFVRMKQNTVLSIWFSRLAGKTPSAFCISVPVLSLSSNTHRLPVYLCKMGFCLEGYSMPFTLDTIPEHGFRFIQLDTGLSWSVVAQFAKQCCY